MKKTASHPAKVLEAFWSFKPFHTIIHNYVDVDCFLIGPAKPRVWWTLNRRVRTSSLFELEKKYLSLRQREIFLESCFRRVRSQKKTLIGLHAGFRDMVVPVLGKRELLGFLMAGSFADHDLSASEIGRCWETMTGRKTAPFGSDFESFVQTLLEIPVLEGPLLVAYQEAFELYARILAEDGDEKSHRARLLYLLNRVFSKSCPHSYFLSWALSQPTAESMPAWGPRIAQWSWVRNEIGISRVPTTVIAVIPRRLPGKPVDPVETAVRIRRFQRRSFQFARSLPETIGGRLENYGAVFVASADPSRSRIQRRDQIADLAEKIRAFASREWGGVVRVGVGETVPPGESLRESYRQAVLDLHLEKSSSRQASKTLSGRSEVKGGMAETNQLLLELLRRYREHDFGDLVILRDRFLKSVLYHSFNNPEEIRWHLQYAILLLMDTVRGRVGLKESETDEVYETLSAGLSKAVTTQEIVLEFRSALERLSGLLEGGRSFRSLQSMEKVKATWRPISGSTWESRIWPSGRASLLRPSAGGSRPWWGWAWRLTCRI